MALTMEERAERRRERIVRREDPDTRRTWDEQREEHIKAKKRLEPFTGRLRKDERNPRKYMMYWMDR